MKRASFIVIGLFLLVACAPVLNRELMRDGTRNIPPSQIRANPDAYKGQLFIFGGVVAETRVTAMGSQIEGIYFPVDSYGYLKDRESADGRFLALYPQTRGMLDPLIYKRGREITIAGIFVGNRAGKIEEMEYSYPVFEIRQIHLWELRQVNYMVPAYPYYSYPHGGYDPWWRPFPPPPGWR